MANREQEREVSRTILAHPLGTVSGLVVARNPTATGVYEVVRSGRGTANSGGTRRIGRGLSETFQTKRLPK